MVERIEVTEPFFKAGCKLGESPIYEHSTSTLHFVDIFEKKVFHLNIHTNELTSETFPEAVTGLALRRGGGLACTVESGFAVIEDGGTLKHFTQPIRPEKRPYTRFNDGACDSKGRFFAGTMFAPEQGIPGLLYRYDPEDKSCVIVDNGFTHSNGIAWSADEHTMFFTCSLTNVIYAYDYDDGTISNRRIFSDTGADSAWESSKPDGLCLDDEGCIWSARWDGSAVLRLDKNGKISLVISIPSALRVTACCFGGPSEDKLYITTASAEIYGGSSERQEKFPDSGHLFMVDFAGRFKGGKWRGEFPL
ncbi:regucalcin [Peniophora sp. CONT]|nr:regucalcin [Peniophora sp. CONT]